MKSRLSFSAKKIAVVSGLFFSIANITDKIAVSNSNPIWVSFFRIATGTVFMFLIMIGYKEKFHLSRKIFFKISLISVFYGFGTVFFMNSIKYAGLSVAIPVISTDIIFATIIAFLFLKEKKSNKLIGSIIVAFAGILLISFGQNEIAIESTWKIGILFGVSTAIFWSIAQNLLKKFLKNNTSPIKTSFFVNLFGLLIIFIFSLLYPFQISTNDIISITISGLLIALGGLFLIIALSKGNVSKVIPIYGAIQPLIGASLGFVIFSENINSITLAGILLISISLLIINKIK